MSTLTLIIKVLLFGVVLVILVFVVTAGATLLHKDAAFKMFTALTPRAMMRLQTLAMIIIALSCVGFLCISLVNFDGNFYK